MTDTESLVADLWAIVEGQQDTIDQQSELITNLLALLSRSCEQTARAIEMSIERNAE